MKVIYTMSSNPMNRIQTKKEKNNNGCRLTKLMAVILLFTTFISPARAVEMLGDPTKLNTPTISLVHSTSYGTPNPTGTTISLVWDEIENAESYMISYTNVLQNVKEYRQVWGDNYKISSLEPNTEYLIAIKAIPNPSSGYSESYWSTGRYTTTANYLDFDLSSTPPGEIVIKGNGWYRNGTKQMSFSGDFKICQSDPTKPYTGSFIIDSTYNGSDGHHNIEFQNVNIHSDTVAITNYSEIASIFISDGVIESSSNGIMNIASGVFSIDGTVTSSKTGICNYGGGHVNIHDESTISGNDAAIKCKSQSTIGFSKCSIRDTLSAGYEYCINGTGANNAIVTGNLSPNSGTLNYVSLKEVISATTPMTEFGYYTMYIHGGYQHKKYSRGTSYTFDVDPTDVINVLWVLDPSLIKLVTATVNHTEKGSISPDTTYLFDQDSLELTISPNSCIKIDTVSINGEKTTWTDNTYILRDITGDINFIAYLSDISFEISDISTPATIIKNDTLTLTLPTITPDTTLITESGWQLCADNLFNDNVEEYIRETPLPETYNGWYLRYYATTVCDTVFSNVVQITVLDCTLPIVGTITDPAPICYGTALTLTTPNVDFCQGEVGQGWQLSDTFTFDSIINYIGQDLDASYDGWYLRYYAEDAGGIVYSDSVQITVLDCNSPTVGTITVPAPIYFDNALVLTVPDVDFCTEEVGQGWQLSDTSTFDSYINYTGQNLEASYNGWYLRYFAEDTSAIAYSNHVLITVLDCNSPTVGTITVPAPIYFDNALVLTVPDVDFCTEEVGQGWQLSDTCIFDSYINYTGQNLEASYNGWYLRYYAEDTSAIVYSNYVQITVVSEVIINTIDDYVFCGGIPSDFIVFTTTNTSGTVRYEWTNDNTDIGLNASGSTNTGLESFITINDTDDPISANITVTPYIDVEGTEYAGYPISFTITINPSMVLNSIPDQVVHSGEVTAMIPFTSISDGDNIQFYWSNDSNGAGIAPSGVSAGVNAGIPPFQTINNGTEPIVITFYVNGVFVNGNVGCRGNSLRFTITILP